MFLVENNVPEVYVNESRDFQLFSRLYDIVFQSNRFLIDSMEDISDTMRCNDTLLPLIATKIGFFTDSPLTDNAFREVLSAFPYIIKNKGSVAGIELCDKLFERILNVRIDVDTSNVKSSHIVVYFRGPAPNIELLQQLIEYIRPTGLLIDYKVQTDLNVDCDYATNDTVTIHKFGNTSFIYKYNVSDTDDYTSNVGFTQIQPVNNPAEETNLGGDNNEE